MSLPPGVTVTWPTAADAALYDAVHRLLAGVVELGGAVGWLHVPSAEESGAWLDAELALVDTGRAAICCLWVDGVLAGIAVRACFHAPVVAHNAEVRKVMVDPALRGRGLARLLMTAVTDEARAAGVEHLVLDVRGNNHGAQALYESLGWERIGVLPDYIAVGEHRFDRVLYHLEVNRPAGLIRHGSAPDGPGSSPLR